MSKAVVRSQQTDGQYIFEPATGPCDELNESSQHHLNPFIKDPFNNILPRSFQSVFLLDFPTKTLFAFLHGQ
jgi:hypothetical protein